MIATLLTAAALALSPQAADVQLAAQHLRDDHPNLFHDLLPARFDATVAALESQAAALNDDELLVGLMRLAALPGVRGPTGGPKGVFTITRHPMMWGFALWAGVHLMVLAMPKALVFDGSIIVLALVGAMMQDRKKSALMGEAWHEWTAQTAFIPFSRGVANPGAASLIGGTLLFLIATWAHPMPVGFWRWIA